MSRDRENALCGRVKSCCNTSACAEVVACESKHFEGNHSANYSGCPQKTLNRKSFPTAPANEWSDPAALAEVKETPISDSNLKPLTQFVPRPVELSHKMPSSEEEFFSHNYLHDDLLLQPNG
ncbi:hypothetical protein AVEN_102949-1 [Araneus ventricosus]|uniref:Uncharacterized protein n=1 Tax=Araneus ventricosus TaxID=182803 RepID=A0A4Y2QA27_ARAVE|nr:hypothetical protein AVEN_102949-1 [Araneus ventricosus]